MHYWLSMLLIPQRRTKSPRADPDGVLCADTIYKGGKTMDVLLVTVACVVLFLTLLVMFTDPIKIGKERKQFTAGDYAWNLVYYIGVIVLAVGSIVVVISG